MKRQLLIFTLFALSAITLSAQPISVGSVAPDFALKNIDGSTISLSDYSNEKGVMVIFSCNPCPYVIAYEDRIIDLHNRYAAQGFPLVLINPNDADKQPVDSMDEMRVRAEEKNYPFPYLKDVDQSIYKAYGATRTPEIFLLKNNGDGSFVVAYTGTVDDNYKDASAVNVSYASNAVNALLQGEEPNPTSTVAIGCSIVAKN
ncbi:MAG: thioredoxin family protein [Fermentimonas sp.]|nr:thioredoxin family protein [Fermentimonas sp.]